MQYHVLARKYRPQRFCDVVGQSAIVTALKNALRFKRVAHAYLFCGTRGTGKTTLARLFSKALNCQALTDDGEPCNQCDSCKAQLSGNALDVLEIDGASNRGIDDIRQLNETVGYAPTSGNHYKIYLIDEVHMLTKEAFNALLKTLEEPPPQVVFFFATTEPHKVPATILSRCQRFQLQRIPIELICEKLASIAKDLEVSAEKEALRLIAEAAEGSLRDAESLLDQIVSGHEGTITAKDACEILGLMPKEAFFKLDEAIRSGDLAYAFQMAHEVSSQGKDLAHFLENLTDHFRHLLVLKLQGPASALLHWPDDTSLRERYCKAAEQLTTTQCLALIDEVIAAETTLRHPRQTLIEALLLRLIRNFHKITPEELIQRLEGLEGKFSTPATPPPVSQKKAPPPAAPKASLPPPPAPKQIPQEPLPRHKSHYDTLLRFAAVELEGTVKLPPKQ